MMEDEQGNLKVLTCQPCRNFLDRNTSPISIRDISQAMWSNLKIGGLSMLVGLGMGMEYCLLTKMHGFPKGARLPMAISSTLVSIGFFSKLAKKTAPPEPLWEIRVYDVKRKTIDAEPIIVGKRHEPLIYFLHNVNTIEITTRALDPIITLKKNAHTNNFVTIETPTDVLSQPMRTARQLENDGVKPISYWFNRIGIRIEFENDLVTQAALAHSVIHNNHATGVPPSSGLATLLRRCRELQYTDIVQLHRTDKYSSLEKIHLTDDGDTVTRSILLPDWVGTRSICAPMQSGSKYVLLNISKENLLFADHNNKKPTQVIVNMEVDSNKRLSPQLEIDLENIIKVRSTAGITPSQGFSLKFLGNEQAWREKLYKLCRVDEAQLDQERDAARRRNEDIHLARKETRILREDRTWWTKVLCGVAAGALLSYHLLARNTY